jgi:hypothetical protein
MCIRSRSCTAASSSLAAPDAAGAWRRSGGTGHGAACLEARACARSSFSPLPRAICCCRSARASEGVGAAMRRCQVTLAELVGAVPCCAPLYEGLGIVILVPGMRLRCRVWIDPRFPSRPRSGLFLLHNFILTTSPDCSLERSKASDPRSHQPWSRVTLPILDQGEIPGQQSVFSRP